MRNKVSSILKMEAECYRRQSTGECCREGVGCDACDLSTTDVTDDDVMNVYNMAIEALKERPQWIPVAERLPEEIGDYLVTEKLSDIARAVYTSSFGHIRTGELCFYYEDDECIAIKNDGIVAWMPLPNPYWEEGAEE